MKASEYVSPVRLSMHLAGNFGEPRFNHSHQGIDVKTNQTVGHTVCAVADGYVSKVSLGLGGFGLALYVTHPSGITSVYCHLQSFRADIMKRYYEALHDRRQNGGIVDFAPGQIPVSAGTPIGLSGNSGASKGPHLHLEFHGTINDNLIDPLASFVSLVDDRVPPMVHGVMVCPDGERGKAFGVSANRVIPFSSSPKTIPIPVWGRVGFAVWANDYSSSTYNKLGVRKIRLIVDGEEIFRNDFGEISSLVSRKVNAWVVNPYFMHTGRAYLKSFSDYEGGVSAGFVEVKEERVYNAEYQLEDVLGNRSSYFFSLIGVPSELKCVRERANVDPISSNIVQAPGVELCLPRGAVYSKMKIGVIRKIVGGKFCFSFSGYDLPLGTWSRLQIVLPSFDDRLKQKYCIVNRSWKTRYLETKVESGIAEAVLRELDGDFYVEVDSLPPRLGPVFLERRNGSVKLICRVSDLQSGIGDYSALIDGRFAVFHYEPKYSRFVCDLKYERMVRRKLHVLEIRASDRCANETLRRQTFSY